MAGGREQSPASSIAEFSREEWDALSERHNRNWFYFQALERLGLPQFKPVYFSSRIAGRLRGAIVGFLVTPEAGAEQPRASGWLQRARPAAWRRAEPAWLEACAAIVDRCFGLDLRERELKSLLGGSDPRSQPGRR